MKRKTIPAKSYLFDVDGVLTNPETLRVEQSEIFDELIKRLKKDYPICFNTGLSLENMRAMVLTQLESRITEKHLLHNIIVIGEKGGALLIYDNNGQPHEQVDETIRVPQVVQDEIKILIKQSPYSETMFYNATKRTMVTVALLPQEKRKGKTFTDFQTSQKLLTKEIQSLLKRHKLGNTCKVDPTRIAIDVESKQVGKAFGAKRFVEILQKRQIKPQEYLCFGDSPSDYAMYKELKRLDKNARFIFVGDKESLVIKEKAEIIFPNEIADKGTCMFLQEEET